ncbi:MAG: hypothetical protein GTO13_18990 [Proteobacteria bacterium]|nr:hypothetical protein [Pseudomonadota bacterium]
MNIIENIPLPFHYHPLYGEKSEYTRSGTAHRILYSRIHRMEMGFSLKRIIGDSVRSSKNLDGGISLWLTAIGAERRMFMVNILFF